ncbi:hypothetical protein Pcinc_001449 [Petrolisthes cinctipes]|uniref:Uncharacterized protein n=1 Tax=Petrolisthes cinctipes TaxID=88211 RepID=A0AAE1GMZ1_PETCI|nr:hypothetical protein Pcinc_001449 [Petrolisthes cinctipes]
MLFPPPIILASSTITPMQTPPHHSPTFIPPRNPSPPSPHLPQPLPTLLPPSPPPPTPPHLHHLPQPLPTFTTSPNPPPTTEVTSTTHTTTPITPSLTVRPYSRSNQVLLSCVVISYRGCPLVWWQNE